MPNIDAVEKFHNHAIVLRHNSFTELTQKLDCYGSVQPMPSHCHVPDMVARFLRQRYGKSINKVSTAMQLCFDVARFPSFPEGA